MPYALCPVPCALCPMPHAPCPIHYTLYPTPYTLHPTPYTLLHPAAPYTIHPTTPHTPFVLTVGRSRASKPSLGYGLLFICIFIRDDQANANDETTYKDQPSEHPHVEHF
jgi:hypothetical protein